VDSLIYLHQLLKLWLAPHASQLQSCWRCYVAHNSGGAVHRSVAEMSVVKQSTFIVTREDRSVDPRLSLERDCASAETRCRHLAHHETVSRLHAGISRVEGYFLIVNLSASSATALNGRIIPFNEAAALTVGDELQIGPSFLISSRPIALRIRVVAQLPSRRRTRTTSQVRGV